MLHYPTDKNVLKTILTVIALLGCIELLNGCTEVVVPGAMAERDNFWGWLIAAAVISGFIYPIVEHWVWGGGWLTNLGYIDYAGSTVVHLVGVMLALMASIVIGPRIGKFVGGKKQARAFFGHSIPLSVIGAWLLVFGWFGFNIGSSTAVDPQTINVELSWVSVTTAMAMAGGLFGAAATSRAHVLTSMIGLLSGAVAYYALLSIIPLLSLILLVLSHVVDEQSLLETLKEHIQLVVPAHAEIIVEQMALFLSHRNLVGWLLVGVLLFFSSMAFTMLENAMSVIFYHRIKTHRRHFLISAIIPYAYIFLLGIGLLIITLVAGALGALSDKHLILLGWDLSLEGTSRFMLYLSGMAGMVIMLTSLYLVMPVGRIPIRYAFAGGVTAAVLWEIIRHILVWYYSTISLVNVIYGSLATAVVALLSIEIAVIILLLGAQVIAEFEHSINETAEPAHLELEG